MIKKQILYEALRMVAIALFCTILTASAVTVLFPTQGGTGKVIDNWTGFVKVTSGDFGTSSIDVSDDTNLTAGRSLTLTADEVLADAELYTGCTTINFPEFEAVDDEAGQLVFGTDTTLTQFTCYAENTTTSWAVDLRATSSPWTSVSAIITPTMDCPPYQSYSTTSFADATIQGGAIINFDLETLQARVASSTYWIICGTKDD